MKVFRLHCNDDPGWISNFQIYIKDIYLQHFLPNCPQVNATKSYSGFYTKGRPLVKSNLICPLDKLSGQPGCPVLDINIQGNFCISQENGSSDNLPENLV